MDLFLEFSLSTSIPFFQSFFGTFFPKKVQINTSSSLHNAPKASEVVKECGVGFVYGLSSEDSYVACHR